MKPNRGGNRHFVLPEQTIGPKGSERVILLPPRVLMRRGRSMIVHMA